MSIWIKLRSQILQNKAKYLQLRFSRYFNHPELLSQKTQTKIEDAIQKLNYKQDHLARILVTGESNLVGVIFPHLHSSFYTELLNQ